MNILILTSSNHLYSNFIIAGLLKSKVLLSHNVKIYEQDSIVPGKSTISGLLKYLKVSGYYYVYQQIIKQLLFKILRFLASSTNNKSSMYYPYYRYIDTSMRELVNNIKNDLNVKKITDYRPDLIVSIFSKEILPESILSIPRYGSVNIHPALLPNYKGVSPTFWCLSNNEKMSGITLHYLDKNIDTGLVISQIKLKLTSINSEHSLYLSLCKKGLIMLKRFLKNIPNKPKGSISSLTVGSYYSIPTKEAVNKFLSSGKSFFDISKLINDF